MTQITTSLPDEAISHIASILGRPAAELQPRHQFSKGYNALTYQLGDDVILKIYESGMTSKTEDEFFRSAKIQQILHAHAPDLVPQLLVSDILESRPLLDGVNKRFVLMERVSADPAENLILEDAARMGHILARFHKLSDAILTELGQDAFEGIPRKMKRVNGRFIKETAKGIIVPSEAYINTGALARTAVTTPIRHRYIRARHLPEGVLHQDFHPPNCLLGKDAANIIDFDNCSYGSFIEDIACSLILSFTLPNDENGFTYRMDLARAFIESYNRERPLAAAEFKMLPVAFQEEVDRFVIRNTKYAKSTVRLMPKDMFRMAYGEVRNSIPAFKQMVRSLAQTANATFIMSSVAPAMLTIPSSRFNENNAPGCLRISYSEQGLGELQKKYRSIRGQPGFVDAMLHLNPESANVQMMREHPEIMAWSDSGMFMMVPNMPRVDLTKLTEAPSTLKDSSGGVAFGVWYIHPKQLEGTVFAERENRENPGHAFASVAHVSDLEPNAYIARSEDRPTIGDIEAETGVPYLTSVLDLTSEHLPLLRELRAFAADQLTRYYGAGDSDHISLYFNTILKESSATLHLHARINEGRHPREANRELLLDDIIEYLEKGKSIKELLMEKNPVYISKNERDMRAFLEGVPGITMDIVENPVILDSPLVDPRDMDRSHKELLTPAQREDMIINMQLTPKEEDAVRANYDAIFHPRPRTERDGGQWR